MTLTKEGKKLNKFIEQKLADIRTEFMNFFSTLEKKDIVIILDIKHEKKNFMRFVN
ncbi:hypothetical protein LCGC14_1226790 [marine sediment metagenome]|uniref:Uncharacterized protein n=1 Tax=marine sediment metagenome TaxID=412755 RepID=A0A0F9PE17_9ZZZZ